MKKVIKVEFTWNEMACAVEQDATGFLWFYIGDLNNPVIDAPASCREAAAAALVAAGA